MNNNTVSTKGTDGLFYVGLQIKNLAFGLKKVYSKQAIGKKIDKIKTWQNIFAQDFVEHYKKKFGSYPDFDVIVSDIIADYNNDEESRQICVNFGYGFRLYDSSEELFKDIAKTLNLNMRGAIRKMKTFYSIPRETIESEALLQIANIEELESLKEFAIMPDVHAGYDMPIGGVALLDNQISPSFVGYDIGCGVSHVNTRMIFDKSAKNFDELTEFVFTEAYKRIPVGFNSLSKPVVYKSDFTSASGDEELTERVREKIATQYGTLGGGNHFIEIGLNDKKEIGITIHSGSRNAGHTVADYYMKKGRIFNLDSELGQAYMSDMNYCLEFALENRKKMIDIMLSIFGLNITSFMPDFINKNHNHAIVTDTGVLHRKGAISAGKNEMGIIPGNMRDGVYIVKGLGNADFLNSASHGAGRAMSRGKAKKNINIEDFKQTMAGIKAKVDSETLDESPFAYKNFDDVIFAQAGKNIEIVDKFVPIINIKG